MKDLEMPSVTICNQNLFKLSVVQAKFPNLVDHLRNYSLFLTGSLNEDSVSLSPLLMNTSFLEIFSIGAPTVHDIFVYCAVKYQRVNCADFISMHLTLGGLCYTFHSKEYVEKHGAIHINKPGRYILNKFNQSILTLDTTLLDVLIHL